MGFIWELGGAPQKSPKSLTSYYYTLAQRCGSDRSPPLTLLFITCFEVKAYTWLCLGVLEPSKLPNPRGCVSQTRLESQAQQPSELLPISWFSKPSSRAALSIPTSLDITHFLKQAWRRSEYENLIMSFPRGFSCESNQRERTSNNTQTAWVLCY